MLRPRIIPCLLYRNKGLVKTKLFSNARYIGDPINTVKIFSEKKADELIFLDIDASSNSLRPDFNIIKKIASASDIPLCYGGGIRTINEAKFIMKQGVEKISLNSIVCENIDIVKSFSKNFGKQSIVVSLDLKYNPLSDNYEIYYHNGKKLLNKNLNEYLEKIQDFGAGELLINSIDNDGMKCGFDINLINLIYNKVSIPITFTGGAGSELHFQQVIQNYPIIGLGAGSFFVYKGIHDAVLITYPKIDFNRSTSSH